MMIMMMTTLAMVSAEFNEIAGPLFSSPPSTEQSHRDAIRKEEVVAGRHKMLRHEPRAIICFGKFLARLSTSRSLHSKM